MNISTEAYGQGKTIDSIHAELLQLENKYGHYLEQEFASEEVAALKQTIEEAMSGSPESADCLRECGSSLLRSIKDKLHIALADQEHIIEESPTADDSTGKKAHEISRATALVVDAESKLDCALDEILS